MRRVGWILFLTMAAVAREGVQGAPWKDVLCGLDRPVSMVQLPALWFGVLARTDHPEGLSLLRAKSKTIEPLSIAPGFPSTMEYDYRRDLIFMASDQEVLAYHRRKKKWIDLPSAKGSTLPSLSFSYMNRLLYFVSGSELRAYEPIRKKTKTVLNLSSLEPFSSHTLTGILVSADGKRMYWTGIRNDDSTRGVLGVLSFDRKKVDGVVELPFTDHRSLGFYQNFVLVIGKEAGHVAARSSDTLSMADVILPKGWDFPILDAKIDTPDLFLLEDKAQGACIKKMRIAVHPRK